MQGVTAPSLAAARAEWLDEVVAACVAEARHLGVDSVDIAAAVARALAAP